MKPKLAYDKIGLQKILVDPAFRTVDTKGRVLSPSNEVYKNISKLMAENGSVITPKHIHTIVNNNRNAFKECVLKAFDIEPLPDTSTNTREDSNFSLEGSVTTTTSASIVNITRNLIISSQKWHSIRPVEKKYGMRSYLRLRAGWADLVAEAMWVQHQLDCVFVSKNNSVHQSSIARYYLTFDGYCSECGAKIRGTILKEPAKDVDVVVKLTLEGLNLSAHSGKNRRQLRGIRRQRVADSLINKRKDAITWRRKEAARLKEFAGKNPPILPSNKVLRKAKEQRLIELYGLDFANPALNLLKNAEEGKYVGCIHHVALLKFNCVYWRPEQLQIYTARCRQNPDAQLILDATGSIAKRDRSQDPHIFLYQCVLVTKDGSVPVFQMVSADQRSLIVAHFLRLLLAANAPIPPIVVTDFGWSLLIAVAEIFGRCANFADYLQKCYNAITKKTQSLPSTFMRLDVCHLAAMVARWTCIKGNDKLLVRRFYKRCVGQAAKMDNLEDLTFFVESVLVIALSQCVGLDVDNAVLPSEERLTFINKKIKGEAFSEESDEVQCPKDEEQEDQLTDETISSHPTDWKCWSDDVFKRAKAIADSSSNGDKINACFNIEFAEKLKKHLLPYVPLWTAIMVPIFGRGASTATSAAVESEFGDLKNRDFKGELPMRVDRFVLQHLERIDEKIKERSKESDAWPVTTANSTSLSSETSIVSTNDVTNNWNVQEEWGGLVKNEKEPEEPKRKQTRTSCFDSCPEWDFIKDAKTSHIPVLMNGSTLGPARISGCDYNVTETCAFDAICQILISGITANTHYGQILATSECPIINFAQDVCATKKILKRHYCKRAEILSNVYFLQDAISTFAKGIKRLVAKCNAAHLAQSLLEEAPSVQVSATCNVCGYVSRKRNYPLLDVNVDILLCGGLHQMQSAIDDCANSKSTCSKCGNQMLASAEYGPHLVVDTSVLTDPGYPMANNKISHTLGSTSKVVNVSGKSYTITGVVGYKAEMSHYVAYILSGDIWHKYDDLIKKRTIVKKDTKIAPHVIIYCTSSFHTQ